MYAVRTDADREGNQDMGGRARRPRRTLALLAAAIGTLGLCLGAAAPAFADSAAITIKNTAGQPDPAAGLPRVFAIQGQSALPGRLFVKERAPGGAPCAPDARSDSGELLWQWWEANVNGDFSFEFVETWDQPGPAMFCIWLAPSETSIATPITQTIEFRSPGGTVGAAISPVVPQVGQTATVTLAGSSEAPEHAYATVKASGGGCAPDAEGDSGSDLLSDEVDGSFSVSNTFSEDSPGTYQLCVWLASSESSVPAVAGPQELTFVVASPPPPPPSCIVPSFNSSQFLAAVKSHIRAGHCSVGRVRYTRSRRVRRGRVVAISPHPHEQLPNGSPVSVVVSVGRG